jgi:hypothetical protein
VTRHSDWIFSHLELVTASKYKAIPLRRGRGRRQDDHVSLSRKYGYRPRTEQDEFQAIQVPQGIIYIQTVQYWGKDGTLRNPCRYFSWRTKFAFYQDFILSASEERSNFLTIYIAGLSVMLCWRLSQYPRTQLPSKYYCWNLGWRHPPASFIEVSYCDLLERQTDLHLISFFPQRVFGLFFKSASHLVCP